jgi:transposase
MDTPVNGITMCQIERESKPIQLTTEVSTMKLSVISIDLAKNVFQVAALNQANKVAFNDRVLRNDLLDYLRQLEPATVAMEACYSANAWGRAIEALGHTVKLIPPIKVKPFVQGNKNDRNDAVAIAEASLRPNMHFVPVKTLEQQHLQCLLRIRERLVSNRTGVMNQLRGLMTEYGVVIKKCAYNLRNAMPHLLTDETNGFTSAAREFFRELYYEMEDLDDRIDKTEAQLKSLLKDNPDYRRIQQIPGIGPAISAAAIASAGNAKQFRNGRQFSAWAGLAPRHFASGESCRIGGISKRGNANLRRLLIHGARSIMNWCKNKTDKMSMWIKKLQAAKPANKVIVAIANKLARILWAVLAKNENYQPA